MPMITRRDFAGAIVALAWGHARALGAAGAAATPLEVLLIRHAEEEKSHPDEHLNAEGRKRANGLAGMFLAQFAPPGLLFAARSSKASHRSMETLTPLSAALGLKIDDSFANTQYRDLAKAILTRPDCAGKRILVCWHQENLPQLARALGAKGGPSDWPGKQFDHVWRLQYSAQGVAFSDVVQRLA